MSDALTIIEDAFRARIKAAVPEFKRVLGPEDFPIPEKYLPCCVIGIGAEDVREYHGSEPGERLIERHQKMDVLIVLDEGLDTFRLESRDLANKTRAALCDPAALGIEIEDIRLVSSQPQTFASEKGSQGGFHLAFVVPFVSSENDPGTILSRQ